MGARSIFSFSILVSAALISACSGRGTVSVPPGSDRAYSPVKSGLDAAISAREAAAEASAREKLHAKLAAGYVYQVSGSAHFIDVTVGKPAKFTMAHGDRMSVKLVAPGEPRYIVSGHGAGSRGTRFQSQGCADDCDPDNADNNGTPAPAPTPPPNYAGCASSGGATWVNDATGEGGCTSRGSTKSLSCGTWSWSSRGRSTLVVPGTGTISDIDYVVDNGDGSCRMGTV